MRPIKHPAARVLLHLFLWLVTIVSIGPFLWTILNSFKTKRDLFSDPPKIFFTPTLQHYQDVLLNSVSDNLVWVALGLLLVAGVLAAIAIFARHIPLPTTAVFACLFGISLILLWTVPEIIDTAEIYDNFLHTIVICIGAVSVSVALGCLSGYGLARYSGAIGALILIVALIFRSLPRLGFILPYFQMGQVTGLYDSYFLVILALVAVQQPFTMHMLRTFFLSIPRDLEEAAMIDGASRLWAFVRVIVPIAWPGIFATSLFTLLVSYHEFILIRILTQSKQTLTVAMTQYLGGVSVPGSVPRQSAAAVLSALPLVIIVLVFQKQFVKGLASGAVKG